MSDWRHPYRRCPAINRVSSTLTGWTFVKLSYDKVYTAVTWCVENLPHEDWERPWDGSSNEFAFRDNKTAILFLLLYS